MKKKVMPFWPGGEYGPVLDLENTAGYEGAIALIHFDSEEEWTRNVRLMAGQGFAPCDKIWQEIQREGERAASQ